MKLNIMTDQLYTAAAYDQLAGQVGQISQAVVPSLSSLLEAVIILIVGYILAGWLGRIVRDFTRRSGFDEIFERAGVKKFIGRRDAKWLISSLLGWAVKWFILLFFITMAVNALGLPQVTQFMVQVLNYLPNLVAAIAILTLGLIIGEMIAEALTGVSDASGVELYRVVGVGLKYLIIVITVLMLLEQIGIHTTIIYVFAAGVALMIGLAGGLAFGLGGQHVAKEWLEDMRKKMK
jgi:hypothetical protein